MFQILTNSVAIAQRQLSVDSNVKYILGQVLYNWSQIRYRRSVAFREYRQPHFKQKLLLSICEPVFKRPKLPTSEKCGHLRPPPIREDHPYDILLANDMRQEFNDSKLICLFHQNQMSASDRRLASNEFEHEGMALRYYNRDIARIALKNTRFESILMNFAIGYPFTILFVRNIEKIDKIIRISKKYSPIILLGAIVEHRRLITIEQLEQLSKLSSLDHQRSLLCTTLMIGQQQMIQTITHHQKQLKQLLDIHSKEMEK